MVKRKGTKEAVLSAVGLRNLIRTATSPAEFREMVDLAKEMAKSDPSHMRWFLEWSDGRARLQALDTPNLELPKLDSLDACIAAMAKVLEAQQAGEIHEEQAESLRKTITASANMHRSKQGEEAAEALEKLGSIPVFPRAGQDRVEAYREIVEGRAAAEDN